MRHRFREFVRLAAIGAVAAASVIALVAVGSASADGPPGGGGGFLTPGASAGTGRGRNDAPICRAAEWNHNQMCNAVESRS